MPAGGETLIVGQYTATWNAVALGTMRGEQDVPTVERRDMSKPINSTDRWGKTTIDAIYLGTDWYAAFVCEEYKVGTTAVFHPYGAMGLLGVIGRLLYGLSTPFVLTAIAGTPAAASPATFTANKSILAPGTNGKLLFGPDLRVVPINLQLLPYDTASSVFGHFTTT